MDLSYRAQLAGWRFVYLEDVVVPAEIPEEIAAFAAKAFDQGMVYLSAWGRDAERVHDLYDIEKLILSTLLGKRLPIPVFIAPVGNFLQMADPKKDVHLYINSPGGSVDVTLERYSSTRLRAQ